MNNHEKIQNKIETGNFIHFNGSVLQTLNIISDSRCRLSSLEYSFKENITLLKNYTQILKKLLMR